jgi:hypothetical protein
MFIYMGKIGEFQRKQRIKIYKYFIIIIMNKIIKFLIIIIILLFFIFNNEIIKLTLKYYAMKYYINKDKCFKIMCEIDDICKKHSVKYYLSEGTALGIYRSSDLIDWDDDVDIALEEVEYNKFLEKCVPELVNSGYYLLYEYIPAIKRQLLAFVKNGQIIDVENVKIGKKCISKVGGLCDELLPHIQKLTEKKWRGRKFPVPEESYYIYLYGKDWKIPRKTKDQNI